MAKEDIVAAAIRALADRSGGLITPDIVVAAARHPDSPLHSEFEWDDTAAAEKYRLDQARALIRSVKVNITTEKFDIVVPQYVRNPEASPQQGYTSIDRIKTEGDRAREIVAAEFRRAASALRRAKALGAALEIEDEINVVAQSITDLESRLSVSRA
jgi:hypothetical protein